MKHFFSIKNIFAIIVIAIIFAGFFGVFSEYSLAQGIDPLTTGNTTGGNPAQTTAGNGTTGGSWSGWLSGVTAQPALMFWYVLMYIAQIILVTILQFVAYFLDNIFFYAIILNPINMPVVVEGWVYLRDIVNGFFILIVLWIALVIIFDIESEKMGNRKLLFRLIAVALAMNFSLAIVSVTFGLANQLALPFYNVIHRANHGDIAGLIIDRTRLQTIFQSVSQEAGTEAQNIKISEGSFTNCGFSTLAPTNEHAQEGCLFGNSFAGEFAASYAKGFTEGANTLTNILNYTVSIAISLILLSAIIAAFIGISAILLLRIIWMVFLGIMAPAAFISHVVPGGRMGKVWNMWLQKLLCWAFIAPAFYFLFYMSLRILIVMTDSPIINSTAHIGIMGNLLNTIPFIVFLGFLWASIMIGRWIGCTAIGEIGVDWGKKLARASVVSTAQLTSTAITGGARLVAGRVAGAAIGASKGLANKPGFTRLIAGAAKGPAIQYIIDEKTKVAEAKKKMDNLPPGDIVDNMRNSMRNEMVPDASQLIGSAQALLDKEGLTKLSIKEQRNVVSLAERIGAEKDFLNANPMLAEVKLKEGEKITAELKLDDMEKLIEKMKPKDFAKIDYNAVGQQREPEEQDILYQKILRTKTRTGNENHLQEFYTNIMSMPKTERQTVTNSWKTVLQDQDHWNEIKQSDPMMYNNYIRYIAGKTGRKLVEKDDFPDWMKQEAKRLDVEGWKPRQKRQQSGGNNQP